MRTLTRERLLELHEEWRNGRRSKNAIERQELNDPRSHGKLITKLWRDIGLETEAEHPMITENRRLRSLLDEHGIPH